MIALVFIDECFYICNIECISHDISGLMYITMPIVRLLITPSDPMNSQRIPHFLHFLHKCN